MCADENKISGGHTVWNISYISRDLNNLTSCVLMKIRAVSAYCSEYDVKKFVFNKTKNDVTKGYLLPDNVYDLHYCYGMYPINLW